MAGLGFSASNAAQRQTDTSRQTFVQIVAAANHRVLIKQINIGFQGTSNTATPILVEFAVQTTAGTFTAALTLVKLNANDDETLQTTAQDDATAEPTTTDVKFATNVHPQTMFIWQSPFGGELVVPGGTRFGVLTTAAADILGICTVWGEE